jgi:hypothetical protein
MEEEHPLELEEIRHVEMKQAMKEVSEQQKQKAAEVKK